MNKVKYLIVIIIYLSIHGLARAGAYEDFFEALSRDEVAAVERLLNRGFDPNSVNPEGVPALMLALRTPAPRVALALAHAKGIRAEVRNDKDESVLMLAALRGDLALVKRLIQADADVNKPGWTALHYAASGGHAKVIEILLDAHAYIDAASPNGTTPLMMAAMYGNVACVQILIDAGADLRLRNEQGLDALAFAQRGQKTASEALIRQVLQHLDQRPRS